jgi:hypothetical protein
VKVSPIKLAGQVKTTFSVGVPVPRCAKRCSAQERDCCCSKLFRLCQRGSSFTVPFIRYDGSGNRFSHFRV